MLCTSQCSLVYVCTGRPGGHAPKLARARRIGDVLNEERRTTAMQSRVETNENVMGPEVICTVIEHGDGELAKATGADASTRSGRRRP